MKNIVSLWPFIFVLFTSCARVTDQAIKTFAGGVEKAVNESIGVHDQEVEELKSNLQEKASDLSKKTLYYFSSADLKRISQCDPDFMPLAADYLIESQSFINFSRNLPKNVFTRYQRFINKEVEREKKLSQDLHSYYEFYALHCSRVDIRTKRAFKQFPLSDEQKGIIHQNLEKFSSTSFPIIQKVLSHETLSMAELRILLLEELKLNDKEFNDKAYKVIEAQNSQRKQQFAQSMNMASFNLRITPRSYQNPKIEDIYQNVQERTLGSFFGSLWLQSLRLGEDFNKLYPVVIIKGGLTYPGQVVSGPAGNFVFILDHTEKTGEIYLAEFRDLNPEEVKVYHAVDYFLSYSLVSLLEPYAMLDQMNQNLASQLSVVQEHRRYLGYDGLSSDKAISVNLRAYEKIRGDIIETVSKQLGVADKLAGLLAEIDHPHGQCLGDVVELSCENAEYGRGLLAHFFDSVGPATKISKRHTIELRIAKGDEDFMLEFISRPGDLFSKDFRDAIKYNLRLPITQSGEQFCMDSPLFEKKKTKLKALQTLDKGSLRVYSYLDPYSNENLLELKLKTRPTGRQLHYINCRPL